MHRRGVSELVSLVFFIAIVVVAIGITLNIALPHIDRMEDTASIQNSITFLTELDSAIQEVATTGQYSSRTVSVRFQDGQYRFDSDQGLFYYEIDTDSALVSAHGTQRQGPVELTANADISVTQESVNGVDCHMMENQYLEACIRYIPETFDPDDHPSLIGYWRLEEETGQWTNDSSRYSNDAAVVDDPERGEPGVWSNAWGIGGDSSPIGYGETDIDYEGSFTVSVWVQADPEGTNDDPRQAFFSSSDDFTLDGSFQLDTDGDGNLTTAAEGGGEETSVVFGEITEGEWQHVTLVSDLENGVVRGYLDGVEVHNEEVSEDDTFANFTEVGIGINRGRTWAFEGWVDEVRVYNRSLTAEEIRWLYLQRGDLQYVNTSELVVHLHNKQTDETLDGVIDTYVNNFETTREGRGHTEPDNIGGSLGQGLITANISTDEGQYDVDYRLLSGADFLTLESAGDQVTAGLDFIVDDADSDTVYVGGEQNPSPGVYTADDGISYGYGVAEGTEMIAGIVAGSGFDQIAYSDTGEAHAITITDDGRSTFLVPFTDGTHADIRNRESLIHGGVYGANRLFDYPSPNFASALTDERTVRASLSYDTIHLSGRDRILSPGTYQLHVENHGAVDGRANVSVTVR